MRPIVNVSDYDQATVIGNMHKNLIKIARVVPEISCRTNTQTHTYTHCWTYRTTGGVHLPGGLSLWLVRRCGTRCGTTWETRQSADTFCKHL